MQPCAFFFGLGGMRPNSCRSNDETCRFSHDSASLQTKGPCVYHFGIGGRVKNSCSKAPGTCPFSHDPASVRRVHLDSDGRSITAAGVLVWRRTPDGEVELYLVEEIVKKSDPHWREDRDEDGVLVPLKHLTDPGGKAEPDDATPAETAFREFTEETGVQVPGGKWDHTFFVPESKYQTFVRCISYRDAPAPGRGQWYGPEQLRERVLSVRLRGILAACKEGQIFS
jgi:8-oxo-dGTP pyrophosphatase MutT (NUDIX family)